MAIIYKWDIPQMNAHIQAEGEDNVIYTVHYRYTGSEESGGKTYSSTNIWNTKLYLRSWRSFCTLRRH
jgi:hypothetical protein